MKKTTKKDKLELDLQNAYAGWVHKPSPETAGQFLSAARPIVDSSLTSAKQSNSPILRSAAKSMVLDGLERYSVSTKVPLVNWLHTQLMPLRRQAAEGESLLPAPERARRQLAAINKSTTNLNLRLGRDPSDAELADDLGISTTKLRNIRKLNQQARPESSFVDEEGAPEPPAVLHSDPNSLLVDYVYFDLPDSDKLIFDMIRDGNPKTEIAKKLKLSPASITQRAAAIAKKLESVYSTPMSSKVAQQVDRDYSCLMVPIIGANAKRMVQWTKDNVISSDVYEEGDDHGITAEDNIHVTVKYGIHTDDVEDVKKKLSGVSPFELTLGNVIRLEPADKEYDVVAVEVSSDKLLELNELICKSLDCTDSYPDYKPHITLAYIKRGTCRHVIGDRTFNGTKAKVSMLDFSNSGREHHDIKLGNSNGSWAD